MEKQDAWLENRVKQTILHPIQEKKGNDRLAKNLISFRDFTKGVRSERKRNQEPQKLKDHMEKMYGVSPYLDNQSESIGGHDISPLKLNSLTKLPSYKSPRRVQNAGYRTVKQELGTSNSPEKLCQGKRPQSFNGRKTASQKNG